MKPKQSPVEFCEQHNAPLVEINGQRVCIAEYLDACIGKQKVVDVIRQGRTIFYFFENGHAVPLLCSCCGAPLDVNVVYERQDAIGRRFNGFDTAPVKLKNGRMGVELHLHFKPKNFLEEELEVPVSLDVAAKMHHPDGCPNTPAAMKKDRQRKMKR